MLPRPAAEHDERDVGDRGDRHDVQSDPARDLRDDGCGKRVARARGGEDVAGVEGWRERRRCPVLCRETRGEGRHRAGAGVDVLLEPAEREVDLSRRAVPAPVELAAEHEPGAHARADRQEEEVVDAACDALPLLPERGEVDVVLEPHREPEPSPRGRPRTSRPRARRRSSRARSCAAPGRRRRARRRRRRSGARRPGRSPRRAPTGAPRSGRGRARRRDARSRRRGGP